MEWLGSETSEASEEASEETVATTRSRDDSFARSDAIPRRDEKKRRRAWSIPRRKTKPSSRPKPRWARDAAVPESYYALGGGGGSDAPVSDDAYGFGETFDAPDHVYVPHELPDAAGLERILRAFAKDARVDFGSVENVDDDDDVFTDEDIGGASDEKETDGQKKRRNRPSRPVLRHGAELPAGSLRARVAGARERRGGGEESRRSRRRRREPGGDARDGAARRDSPSRGGGHRHIAPRRRQHVCERGCVRGRQGCPSATGGTRSRRARGGPSRARGRSGGDSRRDGEENRRRQAGGFRGRAPRPRRRCARADERVPGALPRPRAHRRRRRAAHRRRARVPRGGRGGATRAETQTSKTTRRQMGKRVPRFLPSPFLLPVPSPSRSRLWRRAA